ncbi:MAG: NADH-quinone oxidoreductase subunit NuoN [Steroidobacteraceae bacterium]
MNPFHPAGFIDGLVLLQPEIFLATAACLLLLVDLFVSQERRGLIAWSAVLIVLVTAGLVIAQPWTPFRLAVGNMFILDPLAQVLKVLTLVIVAAVFIYSGDYLKQRSIFRGEYYVLGLFATLGILVLASAANLITVYLGLELLSLSLYAMVAFDRDSGVAAESAMKYFVLSALSSGTLLYGMSIIYGVTGSLDLGQIAHALQGGAAANIGLLFGLSFVIVGVGFKFGAAPFHMWIPDVYQGAPTSVTLYIGSASMVGSLALIMRLLADALGYAQHDWSQMLIVLAVLSMVIGNMVAIMQTNLKRMLAYSTISHVGYLLMGVLAGTSVGYRASLFYTIVYTLMTCGGFGMILLLSRQGFEADRLEDFKGLNTRSPWWAGMMAMLMFSMAGVPPFVGFWAKLGVIQAVLGVDLLWVAVVAVVFSVIGAFYYLRMIKLMYFDEPLDTSPIGGSGIVRTVLSANALAVLVLGVAPAVLLELCQRVFP